MVLRSQGREIDRVESYFGLLETRIGVDDHGAPRLLLNGKPLFQMGVLEQGFWPDGLYRAPTDAALRFDIETAKRLGFNLVRMHQKIEADRWYYWADRLGMLVRQDMPRGINDTEESRRQFEAQLCRMVESRGNHPSIVLWVLFNNAWGKYDVARLVTALKRTDATRPVCANSGSVDQGLGDITASDYFLDAAVPLLSRRQAWVVGLLGGCSLRIADHQWPGNTFVDYSRAQTAEEMLERYEVRTRAIWRLREQSGLSACVYVQLYDVENECNGLMTYDRKVLKAPVEKLRQLTTPPETAPPK